MSSRETSESLSWSSISNSCSSLSLFRPLQSTVNPHASSIALTFCCFPLSKDRNIRSVNSLSSDWVELDTAVGRVLKVCANILFIADLNDFLVRFVGRRDFASTVMNLHIVDASAEFRPVPVTILLSRSIWSAPIAIRYPRCSSCVSKWNLSGAFGGGTLRGLGSGWAGCC